MTALGNHEVTCIQGCDFLCVDGGVSKFRNFTAYLNCFHLSGNESGGYKNLWYSFNYGLAHFVIINTETDFINDPQVLVVCLMVEILQLKELKWMG
jgi:hypothetical protein